VYLNREVRLIFVWESFTRGFNRSEPAVSPRRRYWNGNGCSFLMRGTCMAKSSYVNCDLRNPCRKLGRFRLVRKLYRTRNLCFVKIISRGGPMKVPLWKMSRTDGTPWKLAPKAISRNIFSEFAKIAEDLRKLALGSLTAGAKSRHVVRWIQTPDDPRPSNLCPRSNFPIRI
jgi:hypothetical protein